MKTLKNYTWILAAFVVLSGLASCQDDDEIGFDLSGMYGKTWEGELGYSDEYGNKLQNGITFNSGSSSDHGIGYDHVSYSDGEPYDVDGSHPDGIYKFDWKVTTGIIILKYEEAYFEDRDNTISIYNPQVTETLFTGKVNGKHGFVLSYVNGRSK